VNGKFEWQDLLPVGIAAAVVLVDQLTKLWIIANFRLYEQLNIIPGYFDLVYVTNTGAAFGFMSGSQSSMRQLFFISVAVVALIVILYAYMQLREQGRIFVWSLGMIAGGAVGNLIDRIRLGSVVDFLDFYVGKHHWPAFNVADSAITVGVSLFLLGTFIQHRKEKLLQSE
jgi:signal peptidase II